MLRPVCRGWLGWGVTSCLSGLVRVGCYMTSCLSGLVRVLRDVLSVGVG